MNIFKKSFTANREHEVVKYDPIDESENGTPTRSNSPSYLWSAGFAKRQRSILSHPAVVISQAVIIALLAIYAFVISRKSPTDLACARQLAPYCKHIICSLSCTMRIEDANTQPAPYLETDDLRYVEFTDQNHLMQPSPYRGHPTPEVEEAWLKLWRSEFPSPFLIEVRKKY